MTLAAYLKEVTQERQRFAVRGLTWEEAFGHRAVWDDENCPYRLERFEYTGSVTIAVKCQITARTPDLEDLITRIRAYVEENPSGFTVRMNTQISSSGYGEVDLSISWMEKQAPPTAYPMGLEMPH